MPHWISCSGNERDKRSKVIGERFQRKENNARYLYILKPVYRKLLISIQTDQLAKALKSAIGSFYSITLPMNCHHGGLPNVFIPTCVIGVHPVAKHEQNLTQMWQCVLGYDDSRFPTDIPTC